LTKFSQKLWHQVPWCILSGFCDFIIFDLIMALCFFSPYIEYIVITFFCAQLLLNFSKDFVQTFTEALSSSVLMHFVGVVWLDNFLPNYGPLFFFSLCRVYSEQFLLCATPPTFRKGFCSNFHRSFVI
jgi:hypothetical protein